MPIFWITLESSSRNRVLNNEEEEKSPGRQKKIELGQEENVNKLIPIEYWAIDVDSFPINDRESKIMIDEEPTCHKYLQKIGLLNYVKSVSGIVILKNVPKMVKYA